MSGTLDKINLKFKQIWNFSGGINVPARKSNTHKLPIRQAKIPRQLTLPLSQHIGQASIPVVNVGDYVLKGQLIADIDGYVSSRIHAPSSGIISDIGMYSLPHPSGLKTECIIIETDGKDKWFPHRGAPISGPKSPNNLSAYEIRTYIENAGVVGLGGAVFPSAVKLDVPPGRQIHTLIINAAECEPYITCDDILMQERSEEIVLGARLFQKALAAQRCIIALEDDIPNTYEIMLKATQNYTDECVQVVKLPEKYPTGSEKQLIQALTNIEVPHQQIPSKVGVVCINVGTAASIYQSVYTGDPLLSRIVTITGDAVKKPGNIEALLGTPINELLAEAEIDYDRLDRLVMGGPMMGFSLDNTELPLIKSSNCLLAAVKDELDTPSPALPCIRCARCADSCPMKLLPQQMYWHAKDKNLEKCVDYHVFDCIECGCCSYVCPSNIPLVQYFRYAKSEIRTAQQDKEKADISRQRHEFKEQRIELVKIKRAEQAAKRKAMQAKKKATESAKTASTIKKDIQEELDPIKAAMQRVKAKKEKMQKEKTKDLTD